MSASSPSPIVFDLPLPAARLESGAMLSRRVLRAALWGDADDHAVVRGLAHVVEAARPHQLVARGEHDLAHRPRSAIRRLTAKPTVLLVHALSGDALAGGVGGWWEPVIGAGRALDPRRLRILSFNLLGSCYGSSGPRDWGFPRARDEALAAPAPEASQGAFSLPWESLPATITTWDQAAALRDALDELGVDRLELVTGGSLGGMVALALAALDAERTLRVCPIAATAASSAWTLAFNHVARATLLDGLLHGEAERGLQRARQLAHITYRNEANLDAAQGRRHVAQLPWHAHTPYRVQTWLEHQGRRFAARFDAESYLCLLGSMDHHDLARRPTWAAKEPITHEATGYGLERVRASVLGVSIATDALYTSEQTRRFVATLRSRGLHAQADVLHSPHGHDGFLLSWVELDRVLRKALCLPTPASGASR